MAAYGMGTLPAGIRSRFVDNGNGLTMHVLEAGFDGGDRPCVLLLHGFPELAYSWRKVMLPLAAAGYHVVAPDQRGYGRTTGWDGDYDGDLGSFRMLNLVRDTLGLVWALGYRSVAAFVGHDFGSFRRGLVRAPATRRIPLGGADERTLYGSAADPFDTADSAAHDLPPPPSDQHPRRAGGIKAAAEALPVVLFDAGSQRQHAEVPAGRPRFPPRLLPLQERRLEREQALPAQVVVCRRTGEAAHLLHHGPGQGYGGDGRAEMPSAAEIAACKWLPDDELRVYSSEFDRTGFQGGLQWYRCMTSGKYTAELQTFSGRTIDVPSCFIAGKSDWGIYQKPGDFEKMQKQRMHQDAGLPPGGRSRALGAAGAARENGPVAPGVSCNGSPRRN